MEPTVAYPVIMEDEPLHTLTSLFCNATLHPDCPCHEDQSLLQEVNQQVQEGLLTSEEATRTVKGAML